MGLDRYPLSSRHQVQDEQQHHRGGDRTTDVAHQGSKAGAEYCPGGTCEGSGEQQPRHSAGGKQEAVVGERQRAAVVRVICVRPK